MSQCLNDVWLVELRAAGRPYTKLAHGKCWKGQPAAKPAVEAELESFKYEY
ncbi:hypothetical protein BFJ71_g10306 [Fusarium oxysporum]|nr:hypothetical protein BFJ71_g10306 [Fusarium oxysporum]